MARSPVYLDYHATTPVDERVLAAMLPFFTTEFGNAASSTHAWGWRAKDAVEQARREVASAIGASAREVIFTGGASESNNLAIRGVAARAPADRRHIVVSAIEHKSVLEPASKLGDEGWDVSVLPVGRDGRVDPERLASIVSTRTALVSVMAANNEIGVLQPMSAIAEVAHASGALLHVDAAQAVGKVPFDVGAIGADLVSVTAHKIYGPKGCGALFVRKRLEIEPLIVGGSHERGLRAGTLNVPGIVGLGQAAVIAVREMPDEAARVGRLRDRLLAALTEVGGVTVNGSMAHRLPNNLHVSFDDVDGESLLVAVGDVAVSSGSACTSASGLPSHVLTAIMGDDPVPSASIRFGLGRWTTREDVDYAAATFVAIVKHLRRSAPQSAAHVHR